MDQLSATQQQAKRRQDIQKQIVAVDRQMSLELEEKMGRIPTLKPRDTSFPWVSWIVAAIVLAWWAFGQRLSPDLHGGTEFWALIVGVILAVLALITTLQRVWNAITIRTTRGPINEEETDAIRELRLRKETLQKELESLK